MAMAMQDYSGDDQDQGHYSTRAMNAQDDHDHDHDCRFLMTRTTIKTGMDGRGQVQFHGIHHDHVG